MGGRAEEEEEEEEEGGSASGLLEFTQTNVTPR